MDPYSSHIFLNALLLENLKTRKVSLDLLIEFGMGKYSTVLFSRYAKKVIAYEMQDVEWFKTMMDLKIPNAKLLLSLGAKPAIDHFETLVFCMGTPDYVFVDGHQESRHICIQKCMESKVPYIVFHDTEQPCYRYDEVKLLPGYSWIEIRDTLPWTALITNDTAALEMLQTACLNYVVKH